MRIAINARFLIKGKMEGIGWYSHELIRCMVAQHPEHEFHLIFDRPFAPEFIFNKNVQAHIINPPARHPILWWIWFEISLPNLMRKIKPDIFLSPDGYCSLRLTVPQLMITHDLAFCHYPRQVPFLVRWYYKIFVPRYIAKARHVFAVSEATKQDIIKQYKTSPTKISIAYNGCREEFKPASQAQINNIRLQYSEGKPYLLFVGAMHPRKNVHHLIKGFDWFKDQTSSDYKLILVGRKAWLTEEIDDAYKNAKHQSDIIFLPYLDKEELVRVTSAAWACVAPSYLEGFGVPVLEALNCDVPVLVSNRFSLPEVAGPGGLLFEPDDPQSIGQAIMKLYNEKDHSERLNLGRIHRQKFSWSQTAQSVFEKILKISMS
ncbi:MAG: glycosyltransferase family 4 protein [Saprospiraceae bacterium]|nr:glycosyltransferase family 4 protein [Candidatus Vicinibacter affinis]MBP6172683.1 glycosyltransferase family 4 protein [Saprospiraceae bacterium]MBP6521383.1 glycosyltransferase family 4 protein [Saprospiraceae bacterium]